MAVIMRKPPSGDPSSPQDDPPPAGGRASGRARQFALSRGLPDPIPPGATVSEPSTGRPKARKALKQAARRAPVSPSKPRKPTDR